MSRIDDDELRRWLREDAPHGDLTTRALGLADRGRLAPGLRADFCVWDVEHPHELSYYFGRNPLRQRVWGGQPS